MMLHRKKPPGSSTLRDTEDGSSLSLSPSSVSTADKYTSSSPFSSTTKSNKLRNILVAVLLPLLFLCVMGTWQSHVEIFPPNEVAIKNTTVASPTPVIDNHNKHHCLNDDFKPTHKVSVWTMLNDNPQYVQGAIRIGHAIQQHTTTPHDRVVMELQHKPLSEESWKGLRQAGFIRCVVNPIPPPNLEKTRKDLREKFAVLHIWAMEVYSRVVFIDADTYPRASIDHLFDMDLQGKPIGVTKDIRERKWVSTFNSGVLLLNPSTTEHERLVKLLKSGMEFEYIMSDQGFLNAVYGDNWHEIGFVNNANLALYRFQRQFWDQHKLEDINIIHYTMSKPWNCKSKGPYGPICDVWINATTSG